MKDIYMSTTVTIIRKTKAVRLADNSWRQRHLIHSSQLSSEKLINDKSRQYEDLLTFKYPIILTLYNNW